MSQLIRNPRGSPRFPVGCTARIALRAGSYVATKLLDVGPGGCGVELPWRPAAGERVFLELADARMAEEHRLTGKVAWASDAAPWRCGIAFDGGSARAAAALLGDLVVAYPDLADECRRVESIPADALLVPAASAEGAAPGEAELLRMLDGGLAAGELQALLGERWKASAHVLFALLRRRIVEVRAPSVLAGSTPGGSRQG